MFYRCTKIQKGVTERTCQKEQDDYSAFEDIFFHDEDFFGSANLQNYSNPLGILSGFKRFFYSEFLVSKTFAAL